MRMNKARQNSKQNYSNNGEMIFSLCKLNNSHVYFNCNITITPFKFSHNSHASKVIYTPNNTSFSTILNKRMYSKKFQTATAPKHLAIIVAKDASHVQAIVKYAKRNNNQIKI